jgi:putative ABC transport system permease protein
MPQRQYADCLANRTGLLVGKSLADQYGWRVGQNIALNSNIFQQLNGSRAWTFTLCGIFTDSKARGGDKVVLFHYDYFNETRSFGRDSIGLVALLTDDASHNQAVADAINREFANSAAEVDTVTEQQFAAAFLAQLGDIGLIVTLVVGAAFLTIIMIVGSSFALTVRERTREIGILKALGFSGRRISLIVVGEAIIIAAVGGLVGLALAQISVIGLSYSGQLSTLSMGWTIWLSGIGWILLLGLLTAGIPVYRAFHVNTVTALGKR